MRRGKYFHAARVCFGKGGQERGCPTHTRARLRPAERDRRVLRDAHSRSIDPHYVAVRGAPRRGEPGSGRLLPQCAPSNLGRRKREDGEETIYRRGLYRSSSGRRLPRRLALGIPARRGCAPFYSQNTGDPRRGDRDLPDRSRSGSRSSERNLIFISPMRRRRRDRLASTIPRSGAASLLSHSAPILAYQ